jgi:hypothetical protein
LQPEKKGCLEVRSVYAACSLIRDVKDIL